MARFLLRLFWQSFLLFFLSFTLIFFILRILGDPAQMLLGQRSDQASLEAIRAALHLDKPLWQQYLYAWLDWLPYEKGRWQVPSLGVSYQYGKPVLQLYLERLPATLILSSAALGLALVLGVFGGLYQAHRPSQLLSYVSLFLLSMPSYVLGLILIGVFVIALGEWTNLPLLGYIKVYEVQSETFRYQWEALLMPALALALRPAAYLFQLTSTQAHIILRQDYIRAAYARGKKPLSILFKDVLRNIFPVITTALTQWIAGLFTGALFVEELFDWPGIGKLLFSALMTSDFPVVMGIAQLSALLFVLLHAGSEILARWSDPRLRE
ncbi:MAG: ABC transporter permease [Bacteroidia bacterium]|nr:ABC transporter permease [Bacteroidia bacterium]MDW8134074.1 ABC transporter permease [Bacteroidia bacterium]